MLTHSSHILRSLSFQQLFLWHQSACMKLNQFLFTSHFNRRIKCVQVGYTCTAYSIQHTDTRGTGCFLLQIFRCQFFWQLNSNMYLNAGKRNNMTCECNTKYWTWTFVVDFYFLFNDNNNNNNKTLTVDRQIFIRCLVQIDSQMGSSISFPHAAESTLYCCMIIFDNTPQMSKQNSISSEQFQLVLKEIYMT